MNLEFTYLNKPQQKNKNDDRTHINACMREPPNSYAIDSQDNFVKFMSENNFNSLNDQVAEILFKPNQHVFKIICQLFQRGEEGKSLSKILYYVNVNSQQIPQNNGESILFFGNTGCGKTTLAAYLSGHELQVKQDENQDLFLDYRIKENEKNGKIGNLGINSQTFFPNKFKNDQIEIWDNPGFTDSRGSEIDIVNSYCMHKILQRAKGIKLVFIIDGDTLNSSGFGDSKGDSNKKLFEALFYLTQNSNLNFKKNVVIVFTKTIKELSYYSNKLSTFFKSLLNSKDYQDRIQQQLNFEQINKFFDQVLSSQMYLFAAPNQNQISQSISNECQKSILQGIQQAEFYYGKDFDIPYSLESQKHVQLLNKYFILKVNEIMKCLFSEMIPFVDIFNNQQFTDTESLFKQFEQEKNSQAQNNLPFDQYLLNFIKDFMDPFVQIIYENEETKKLAQEAHLIQTVQENTELLNFFLLEIFNGILQIKKSYDNNNNINQFEQKEFNKEFLSFKRYFNQQYKMRQDILQKEKNLQQIQEQLQSLNENNSNKDEKIKELKTKVDYQEEELSKQMERLKLQIQKKNKKDEEEIISQKNFERLQIIASIAQSIGKVLSSLIINRSSPFFR